MPKFVNFSSYENAEFTKVDDKVCLTFHKV